MSETFARVTEVFHEVFEDEALELDRGTTAQDVTGWDSIMHVSLLMRMEQVFDIRFTSAEVADLADVGALVDLVDAKRGES